MKLSIRTVRADDLQAVVDIDRALFGAESFSSFAMRQFLNLFPDSFFVAEHDSQLVGYATIGVQPSAKHAWLISAGVLERHQHKGSALNSFMPVTHTVEICQSNPVGLQLTRTIRMPFACINEWGFRWKLN